VQWKTGHRQHHEFTMHRSDCQILENYPPVFCGYADAWGEYMDTSSGTSCWVRALLRYQHILAYPIIIFAGKINKFILDFRLVEGENALLRRACLLLHYATIVSIAATKEQWFGFLFVVHLVAGLLHLQLLFSHITTEHHDNDTKNDKRQQILHSINYSAKPYGFWHYFHVSLAHQIEHHIDPKIASQHLHKITGDVKELCQKHELPYRSVPFCTLLWQYNITLKDITRTI